MELAGVRIVRLALALTLMLPPTPVFAECAWVLWHKVTTVGAGGTSDFPLDAFDSRKECHARRREMSQIVLEKPNAKMQEVFTCFPDTVDPRGPKR
jgi:hypothetical protein